MRNADERVASGPWRSVHEAQTGLQAIAATLGVWVGPGVRLASEKGVLRI